MTKKHSQKRKRKKRTKRLKNIDTKLDEIKEYVGKIKKRQKFKNEKPVFKHIIKSKDEMNKFEKEKFKKGRKIKRNNWFDWLIN